MNCKVLNNEDRQTGNQVGNIDVGKQVGENVDRSVGTKAGRWLRR